jgi:hypothetical protein
MKAAKMQFGRIYGIGLIVLGLVLLALQFVHDMTPLKKLVPRKQKRER